MNYGSSRGAWRPDVAPRDQCNTADTAWQYCLGSRSGHQAATPATVLLAGCPRHTAPVEVLSNIANAPSALLPAPVRACQACVTRYHTSRRAPHESKRRSVADEGATAGHDDLE